jgi:putative transposase
MARKPRIEYEGAIYHVMSRGNGRSAVFRNDKDRASFVATLGEACRKTGWQIHAYCLMRTHFHLVAETPQANLVAGMKWFLGTYTIRFNRRHKIFGHLFSGRYKALPVDGSGNGYLRTACDYVHLNPARAKLLQPDEKLEGFPWSSYREYLKEPKERPAWLRVDRMLGECGIPQDGPAGRRQFKARTEARRAANDPEFQALKRGWYLGAPQFRQELLEQLGGKRAKGHFGEASRESEGVRAEAIARKALRAAHLREKDLEGLPKGAKEKLKVARRLREETTMTLEWIAERLRMGTAGHLSHLLYWEGKTKPRKRTK